MTTAKNWLDELSEGASHTTTTADFSQPAPSANVTVPVLDSSWMAVGQAIFIATGGSYTVASIPSPQSVTLTNLGYGGAAPSSPVLSGSAVSPTGVKGADGASESTLAATAAFTAAKAFRYQSGAALPATTDLRNRPIHGVASQDVGIGATGPFQTNGPLKASFNLGAGVACAVGVTSAGVMVRATDPTCASAPNWVGDCDTSGLISINPRRSDARRMTDFGGIPNDSSSTARIANTAAIWAMQMTFTAGTGGDIIIEAGDWYFAASTHDTSAAIHIVRPVHLRGEGSSRVHTSTRLLIPDGIDGIRTWHGGMSGIPDPTSLADGQGCTIESLYLEAEGLTVSDGTFAHGIHLSTSTRVSRCTVYHFGGDGVHIESTTGGFPDAFQLDWVQAETCNNGVWIQGADTNNGSTYNLDCRNNRRWGLWEHSFLGNSHYEPHMDNNLIGAYSVFNTGNSSFVNRYSESDQGPSESNGGFSLGCNEGAGQTTDSVFFGGLNPDQLEPVAFVSKPRVPALTATGTNPPRIGLTGLLTLASVNVRIEVTTAGYPGGYDAFGVLHGGSVLVVRWSLDGGGTWTSGVSPHRADNPSVYGLSVIDTGFGLQFVFCPYLYSSNNVYTSLGSGGLQSVLRTGTNDGSMAPFSWGHVNKSDPNSDQGDWSVAYNATTKRWEQRWLNAYASREYTSSLSLPGPGHELNTAGVWAGTSAHGYRRVGWFDGSQAVGSPGWLSANEQRVQWFGPGDLLINRGSTQPSLLIATTKGGWATRGGWTTATAYRVGDTITPSTPNGYLYRCDLGGTSAGSEPSWTTVSGATFSDNGITWECWGPVGSPFKQVGPNLVPPVSDSVSLPQLVGFLRAAGVIDSFVPPANAVLMVDASSLYSAPTVWKDYSGAGNNLTAHGTVTWAANGPNGMPAVSAAGAGWFAGATAFGMGATNWTIFAVMKVTGAGYQYMAGWGGGSDGIHLVNGSANQREILAAGVRELIDGSMPNSTWEVWCAYNDGTNTHLEVNGSAQSLTFASSVPLAPTTPFGLFNSDGSGTSPAAGSISFVLACNTDIGSSERARVTSYLRSRFAL